MRTVLALVVVVLVCALLTGCAGIMTAPVAFGFATIFTDYTAPLDLDADPTVIMEKKGEASLENILGLVIVGDASIAAAADEGGITKVHHIDYNYRNILGIYAKYTTIVYGE